MNDEFITKQRQNRRRKNVLVLSVVGFLILTFVCIYYFSRPNPNASTNNPATVNQSDANQSSQDTTSQNSVQNNQVTSAPVTNTEPAANSSQQTQSSSTSNDTSFDDADRQQLTRDETYIVQDSESYFCNEPNYEYKRRGHVLQAMLL